MYRLNVGLEAAITSEIFVTDIAGEHSLQMPRIHMVTKLRPAATGIFTYATGLSVTKMDDLYVPVPVPHPAVGLLT